LHDNPLHLAKLVAAAAMGPGDPETPEGPHLTLHEIIHPPRLINGMDFSFRALARVAALKAALPTRVHVLLGNHELAQAIGTVIVKDGVRVVEAFDAGLDFAYTDRAPLVREAIHDFILSMPLALRCECLGLDGRPGGRRILCAHSLP